MGKFQSIFVSQSVINALILKLFCFLIRDKGCVEGEGEMVGEIG